MSAGMFCKKYLFKQNVAFFLTSNRVRTWTEPFEPEPFVCVQVRKVREPNLKVQVQVQAHDPRTRT